MRHIQQIVAAVGDFVEIDDDVEEKRRLDRARVLVRTPWKPIIHHSVAVTIGEVTHSVQLVEEIVSSEGGFARHHRSDLESSELISSDDGDSDTLMSRWSSFSLGIPDGDDPGVATVRRTEMDPTGGQFVNDPPVIDQCGLPLSSRPESRATDEVIQM